MSEREESAERAHDPTPHRLERARRQGDLPQSRDAQSFAAYLGLTLAVGLGGPWAAERIGSALRPFLDRPGELARWWLSPAAGEAGLTLLAALAPPLALALLAPGAVVLALLVAQRGIVLAPVRLRPKLSRLSPVANARQRFGPRGLVEFAKSAAKLAAVAAVLGLVLGAELDRLARYAHVEARLAGPLLGELFRRLALGVVIVAAAIGAFDLVWQWFDHRRRLRMTREELKEELRQNEGDPHMRAERRERGRQIATNRMLLAVPDADVVVTNPTHYAVALEWDRSPGSAPRCVAKGVDAIALAIRERAEAAGVPIHRDPPTARSLHQLVEIGEEIRPEHYRAVAAAIVFADEMRRRARERGHATDRGGGGTAARGQGARRP